MYNLNYTYLTELEVDTRQTFTDLSDDLLLLDVNEMTASQTVNAKTLVTSWQDFFWKSDNSNKGNLNVTFTDLSVYHSVSPSMEYGSSRVFHDGKDMSGKTLADTEILTIKELEDYYDELDSTNAWASTKYNSSTHKFDGKNFTELCCSLLDAIDTLQKRMLNNSKVYPTGSIIITDENPNNELPSYVGGNGNNWVKKEQAYISEPISKLNIGQNPGKSYGTNVGYSLGAVKLIAQTNGLTPGHSHTVEFNPTSDSDKGSTDPEIAATTIVTCSTPRDPGQKGGRSDWTDGGSPNTSGVAVGRDHAASKSAHDSGSPTFNVSPDVKTLPGTTANGINVAPTTYPMEKARIWERQ